MDGILVSDDFMLKLRGQLMMVAENGGIGVERGSDAGAYCLNF